MEWIKCEKTMPDEDSVILCCSTNDKFDTSNPLIGCFTNGIFYDYSLGLELVKGYVTHWMPLPDEPKD